MIGLLDTHTFIWWDVQSRRLSPAVRAFLLDPENKVLPSVVSVWEFAIKARLGKLAARVPLSELVAGQQANGVIVLPVTLDHVLAVDGLPGAHRDPFDRLLVAQAIVEGAVLLSADPVFDQYPVQVLW